MTSVIDKMQLPYNAQLFLEEKFIEVEANSIEQINNTYKVELENKINIIFDYEGNWSLINSDKKLPDHIIPNAVKEKIQKIKKSKTEYKNNELDINEIRKILDSYKIILDHYLEFHVYDKSE